MKTQQEIEEMKNEIQQSIQRKQELLCEAKSQFIYESTHSQIKQLMAQYNILLEVLK